MFLKPMDSFDIYPPTIRCHRLSGHPELAMTIAKPRKGTPLCNPITRCGHSIEQKIKGWEVAMKRILQVICWLSLLSGVAIAQTATLSGTVKDQSGAVLPGVQITVANPATSFNRSVVSGERGDYVIPLLPVGRYDVTAE